jgi:hypothetical protein
MATGILKVKGTQVVGNDDKPVILRGCAIGGWLKSGTLFIQWTDTNVKQHGEFHCRLSWS